MIDDVTSMHISCTRAPGVEFICYFISLYCWNSSTQNMHLWLLFLTGTAVYGVSRISEPGLKAINFAKAIEGRKLNGSVIKEVEVDSEESCSFECLDEEKCRSYNCETTSSKAGGFKCQLSDSDRFVGLVNFTEDQNFNYVGIQAS